MIAILRYTDLKGFKCLERFALEQHNELQILAQTLHELGSQGLGYTLTRWYPVPPI